MHDEFVRGIARFREQYADNLPWDPEAVVRGQSPKIAMLTCSDSRVVPHLTTGSGVGQLFMLRNAGNFVPRPGAGFSEEASLCFAVDGLRVEHAIVCGHTHCFAVGALNGDWRNLDPTMIRWFENAERARAGASPLAQVEHNVLIQVARLKQLPCVHKALAEGRLQVHGMVYDIESGRFTVYDAASETFVRVGERESSK
ncbi:MAG: hypothetical protein LGR52_15630 [Candidatus Thiosymbion ectosymbiont of Robbea hypermnestra]|nr:hypothetical protein [Candidatus Thiosymbion ectosymbiont of Robbea hypermnestra]